MRKGTCLGVLAVAALLLAGWLSGCVRPDLQSQADISRVAAAVGECHAAGSRAPEEMPEDVAALGRLGVALQTSAARAFLVEAWALLRDIAREQGGRMVADAVAGLFAPEGVP